MTQKPMASYALAKVVAILKAHADNGTTTNVSELAAALQADISSMSHSDLVVLIENTMSVLSGQTNRNGLTGLN